MTTVKIDFKREPKVLEYSASEKWREVYNNDVIGLF